MIWTKLNPLFVYLSLPPPRKIIGTSYQENKVIYKQKVQYTFDACVTTSEDLQDGKQK